MHDISLYLLEVLENSVSAGAQAIAISLTIDAAGDLLEIIVDDDGRGLVAPPADAVDPFYTTKSGKRTGLGLSLFKAEAEAAGGTLAIGPSPDLGGVRVHATLQLSHVDRPPLGDLATTLLVTAATNPNIDLRVSLSDDEAGIELHDARAADALPALAAVSAGRAGWGADPARPAPQEADSDGRAAEPAP